MNNNEIRNNLFMFKKKNNLKSSKLKLSEKLKKLGLVDEQEAGFTTSPVSETKIEKNKPEISKLDSNLESVKLKIPIASNVVPKDEDNIICFESRLSTLAKFVIDHIQFNSLNIHIPPPIIRNDTNFLEAKNIPKKEDFKKEDKFKKVNINTNNPKNNIVQNLQNIKLGPIQQKKNKDDNLETKVHYKQPESKKQNEIQEIKYKLLETELQMLKKQKQSLNVIVCGHVDAGKSTIIGHLLHLVNKVEESKIRKYKKESAILNKKSFFYAWVMDASQEERERGVTIDVTKCRFETLNYMINILDAPGHKDFVKNMINGAQQADVVILVVDSTDTSNGGLCSQTKEHAILCRSLGMSQIIVAINKLELCQWNQSKFMETKEVFLEFLVHSGYKLPNIKFVPVSGLLGQNILDKEKNDINLNSWYEGNSLIEEINSIQPPMRLIDKDLRILVVDYYQGGHNNVSSAYVTLEANVVQGFVKTGQKTIILPSKKKGIVKSIRIDDSDVNIAVGGQHCQIQLDGVELTDLNPGSVLNNIVDYCQSTKKIRCKLLVFKIGLPLMNGTSVVAYINGLETPAFLHKIEALINNEEIMKKNPRHLTKKQSGIVILKLENEVCCDTFDKNKDFSRILVRRNGESIACGVVTEIIGE